MSENQYLSKAFTMSYDVAVSNGILPSRKPFVYDRGAAVKNGILDPIKPLHMNIELARKNGLLQADEKGKKQLSVTSYDDALQVGNYIYKEGELHYIDSESKKDIYICNFAIKINKKIVRLKENINEQNKVISISKDILWSIVFYCMGELLYPSEPIKITALFSMKGILKFTEDRGYIDDDREAKREFKKYIHFVINHSSYSCVYEYESTGWKNIEGQWFYVTDIGVLGNPTIPYRANVPYHFDYLTEKVGTFEIFNDFKNMKELCPRKLSNSTFLMHYSHLAVLTTLYQLAGYSINFVVGLIGMTNAQKTSTAVIFSRLFDRTPTAAADIRFNSTEISILEKMAEYGDSILLVDDMVPYKNRTMAKEQAKKTESIIRSYGDRVARMRSKIYSKVNEVSSYSPVRGCVLITGEEFEAQSDSSVKRMIQLTFDTNDVDLKMLSYYQKTLLNFTTFFYDYIKYITDNFGHILDLISETVPQIRSSEVEIATPRFRNAYGVMASAIKIFYNYAVERNFMTPDDANISIKDDAELVHRLILNNDIDSQIQNSASLICIALHHSLQNKSNQIYTMKEAQSLKNFEGIAITDEDFIYILPDTLWHIYRMYCKEVQTDIRYKNGRELTAPLRREQLVLVKEEGSSSRATHKINVPTSKRFLCIKKKKFNALCNTFCNY